MNDNIRLQTHTENDRVLESDLDIQKNDKWQLRKNTMKVVEVGNVGLSLMTVKDECGNARNSSAKQIQIWMLAKGQDQ